MHKCIQRSAQVGVDEIDRETMEMRLVRQEKESGDMRSHVPNMSRRDLQFIGAETGHVRCAQYSWDVETLSFPSESVISMRQCQNVSMSQCLNVSRVDKSRHGRFHETMEMEMRLVNSWDIATLSMRLLTLMRHSLFWDIDETLSLLRHWWDTLSFETLMRLFWDIECSWDIHETYIYVYMRHIYTYIWDSFETLMRLSLFWDIEYSWDIHREVGGWGRDPKKCTGRDWGMGSSTI